VNLIKRFTILFLLTVVFAHAAAYAPLGGAPDACEADCCAAAHPMTMLVPAATSAAEQCCIIECPPAAEVPPVLAVSSSAQPMAVGLLPAAPPAHFLASLRAQLPRALPQYLPASSCRYLQTGALLI
jgi:hypothetical protein